MFVEVHVERGRIRALIPCATGSIIRTETSTFEFPGCSLYPGFVDNHAHIMGLGEFLSNTRLDLSSSEQNAVDLLKGSEIRDGWMRGRGWNHELWTDPTLPSRRTLDNEFPHTPVYATRIDGHCAWVNSAALIKAGIDPSDHSGLLIDDDMLPVMHAMPEYSDDTIRDFIMRAAVVCSEHGITEVHDMDVSEAAARITRDLAESGKLPIRVQSFVRGQNGEWLDHGLLPAGGEFHRVAGVKLFADGALGSRGALLAAPYTDDASTCGIEVVTVQHMLAQCHAAIDAGWQAIAIHAIGDQAVHNVIHVYEQIRQREDAQEIILRIEHAQHVRPEDVARMSRLNIIACVQPTHCISDAVMAEKRLGDCRLPWAYRWRSLLESGIHMGAGSDFPIEDPSVIAGIDAFVRRIPRGMQAPWQKHECIGQDEALYAFTEGAHITAGMDYRRGRLEVGYDADFTIVDRDLLSCTPDEIHLTNILATFTAGVCRYSRYAT
ncbi:MAG: amidohydrolase [Ignavibacteria bacterium]|nr:amidohydrolase [Ignavibacteria bacterium]